MRTNGRKIAAAASLVCLASIASIALGGAGGARDNMGITSVEIAQLPLFCWGSLEVPNSTGPEFNFPRSCGPAMNHYCGGLVQLIRAKNAPNKQKRLSLLGGAEANIRYTERGMEGYPDCPIRKHVEASIIEVNKIRRLYGGVPPVTSPTPK